MWNTYPTNVNYLEDFLMSSNHVLIAGASGSGKSVLIRRCLIDCAASGYSVALIDPKKLELRPWRDCVNTVGYADEIPSIISLLHLMTDTMDARYRRTPEGQYMSGEPDIWVIIDEYADLVTIGTPQQRREIKTLVQRIAQLGRAARIHVLLATQRPTRDIIDGAIKVNITTRLALHCPTAQDSRNIINYSGAELLPIHGQGYLLHDSGQIDLVNVPMIDESEAIRCREFLKAQRPQARQKRRWFFKTA